jgi:hypothetical protein
MNHRVSLPRYAVVLGALALLLARPALAQPEEGGAPPITPYRPSVSSPAQLSAPGQLELELGGQRAHSRDQRRTGLPYLFKLAFNEEWAVLVGGEAHVRVVDDTGRLQGVGDTTLVAKRAWKVDEASSFGAEAGAKLPTAKDGIGSGKADYTLNTIYSRDLGPVHLDANANVARLGAVDEPGSSRVQWGASAAFSGNLAERWGLTGEVSGTHRDGAPSGLQVLAALTYSPTKRLTFDVGAAHASRPAPATNTVFAGVVLPLGRLW